MRMKRFFGLAVWLTVIFLTGSWSTARIELEVTGDRVNLRAEPRADAEVVSQVSRGDALFTDKLVGNWIEVVPPESSDLWVYGELVKDGVVAVSKLRVRAGRGINYPAVGRLEKGDKLVVRATVDGWLKIAPPDGCSLWVSSSYVRPAKADPAGMVAKPAPVKKLKPQPRIEPRVLMPPLKPTKSAPLPERAAKVRPRAGPAPSISSEWATC